MAKAKYTSKHHLQRFFIIFGVIFSLAALGIIVYSSQRPTNTQSDASESRCKMTPIISLISSEGAKNSVTYTLKVFNDSSIRCRLDMLYYVEDKYLNGWTTYFTQYGDTKSFAFGDIAPQAKNKFKFTVKPPTGLIKGTYTIPISACWVNYDLAGDDGGLSPYNYWIYKTTYCSKIYVQYTKD